MIQTTSDPNIICFGDRQNTLSVFLMDAGSDYPNDRFSAVILSNVSRHPNKTSYTFIQMNRLGMYGFGEVSKDYLDAVARQDPAVKDRGVTWSDLPVPCQSTLETLLPGFLPGPSQAH